MLQQKGNAMDFGKAKSYISKKILLELNIALVTVNIWKLNKAVPINKDMQNETKL